MGRYIKECSNERQVFFKNYFLQQLEKLLHAWKCKILCISANLANSMFVKENQCTAL